MSGRFGTQLCCYCSCMAMAWEAIKLLINLFAKQIIVGLLLLACVLGSRDIAVNKTEKISCLLVADRLLFSVSMESLNL